MRSATIIASLALTLLAAPLPTSENLAPARRAFIENGTPVEVRTFRNGGGSRTSWARDVQEDDVSEVKKRGFRPVRLQTRPSRGGRRSVPFVEDEEDTEELNERGVRVADGKQGSREGKRSFPLVEDEEDDVSEVEKRRSRPVREQNPNRKLGRRSVPLVEDEEEDVSEVEKRYFRPSYERTHSRGGRRSVPSVEDEAGLSERAIKQGGKDTRSVEDEEDVELGRRLLKIGGKNSRSVDEEDVELGKRIL